MRVLDHYTKVTGLLATPDTPANQAAAAQSQQSNYDFSAADQLVGM